MKKINYGFAAIGLMLLIACSKVPDVSCNGPTNDAALSRKLIIGEWIWSYSKQYSRQSGTSTITTPKSDSIAKTMIFYSDGRLKIYKNSKLEVETTYQFRKMSEWSLYPPDSLKTILSWKNSNVIWKICTDSLYLPYQTFAFDAAKDEVWEKK